MPIEIVLYRNKLLSLGLCNYSVTRLLAIRWKFTILNTKNFFIKLYPLLKILLIIDDFKILPANLRNKWCEDFSFLHLWYLNSLLISCSITGIINDFYLSDLHIYNSFFNIDITRLRHLCRNISECKEFTKLHFTLPEVKNNQDLLNALPVLKVFNCWPAWWVMDLMCWVVDCV